MNCHLGTSPVAQFLTDAGENQHVGVHRHTDGEHDTRNTRQCQRRTNQRHEGDQQHQVGRQRHDRNHAEDAVIENHEQHDQRETELHGFHPEANIFCPQ